MKKNITTFAEHLERRYGKPGFKKRDEFEYKSRVFMIGEMIKEQRKKAKLTQQQLAERSGTQKSYICRIESGLSDIQLSTLMKIAESGFGKHLQVSIA